MTLCSMRRLLRPSSLASSAPGRANPCAVLRGPAPVLAVWATFRFACMPPALGLALLAAPSEWHRSRMADEEPCQLRSHIAHYNHAAAPAASAQCGRSQCPQQAWSLLPESRRACHKHVRALQSMDGPIVSAVARVSSAQPQARKIAKALPRLCATPLPKCPFAKSRPSATAPARACRRQEADRRRLYACLCFALLSARAASGGMRAFPDCSPSILVAPPARMESSRTRSLLVSPNPLAAPRC